jgi:predicted Holliday junction resolvase-like endonuclease
MERDPAKELFAWGVTGLAAVEELVPYKNRLPKAQTKVEKEIKAALFLTMTMREYLKKHPTETKEQVMEKLSALERKIEECRRDTSAQATEGVK